MYPPLLKAGCRMNQMRPYICEQGDEGTRREKKVTLALTC